MIKILGCFVGGSFLEEVEADVAQLIIIIAMEKKIITGNQFLLNMLNGI
jgi:hypothetical protein